MDISGRMSTRDQRAPSTFYRSRKEVQPPRQDVLYQEFCSSVQDDFSVTLLALRLAHPVSDYFVAVWEQLIVCFTCLFLGLVFTFFICFRIICIQYGVRQLCGGNRASIEASVSEFRVTQWNLLPSSYTVCGLFSRTVEASARHILELFSLSNQTLQLE